MAEVKTLVPTEILPEPTVIETQGTFSQSPTVVETQAVASQSPTVVETQATDLRFPTDVSPTPPPASSSNMGMWLGVGAVAVIAIGFIMFMMSWWTGQFIARANCGAPLASANEYLDRGNKELNERNYDCAIADYTQSLQLNPQNGIAYNRLCWVGSLSDKASTVIYICNKAVELNRLSGVPYHSRGLARALTGDYTGAIEDFKFYIKWARLNGQYKKTGAERERWITELQAGRNPFDEATLEKLRQEWDIY